MISRLPLALLAIPAAVLAQNGPVLSRDESRIVHDVDSSVIRRITTELGSRTMEGRLPGSAGGDRAERYLAARFAEFGLAPLGDSGTYLQRVPVRQISLRSATALAAGTASLHWPEDFVLLPGTVRDSFDVTAPITLLRYGRAYADTTPPALHGEEVRGRIVVVSIRPLGTGERAQTGAPFQLGRSLRSAGAAAVVFVNAEAADAPFAVLRSQLTLTVVRGGDVVNQAPKLAPIVELSPAGGERLLRALGSDRATELAIARRDGVSWQATETRASFTIRADVRDGVAHNVIGVIRGGDSALAREAVVLSAHHDHLGVSRTGAIYAGAIDNAMGTAHVLAAASAIERSGVKPRRSIIVLITTGEEFNFFGARYWVDHPTWPRDGIVADVNLEGDQPERARRAPHFVHAFNADSTTVRETFIGAAHALGDLVVADQFPDQHADTRSDASVFAAAHIPSAFLFVYPDTGAAFRRSFAEGALVYHQPADTVHADWSYGAIREKAVLAAILAWRLAMANDRARAADSARARQCPSCAEWNAAQQPFRIWANTYYVGTHGLAAILVTSPSGHVLIDGGLPESADSIADHIRQLGFRVEDVKLILNSHAHYDHAGGIAALQRLSGERVAASPWSARVLERGRTLEDDPQYGIALDYPAVRQVRVITDGDTMHVGQLALVAHFTPGHTPGSTTWTWRSCDRGTCHDMVYADSQTPVSADAFQFSRSRAVDEFHRSFKVLNALPCDILLTPHPGASQLFERLAAGTLVDHEACRGLAAAAAKQLDERLAKERSRPR